MPFWRKKNASPKVTDTTLSYSNTGYAAGQIGAYGAATDAAVTDVTIDGMEKFLDMAYRVRNRTDGVRPGSLFEAILASKENVQFVRDGSSVRTHITHLEGKHRAAADLERRVGSRTISQVQAKYSAQNTDKLGPLVKELLDPKYSGMDLLVPEEKYAFIEARLRHMAETSTDAEERARCLNALKRLVKCDTSGPEVDRADHNPKNYAFTNEVLAVGREMAVTAGIAAASAAVVTGSISTVKNAYAVYRGDKSAGEGALDTAKATGKSALRGAATGAAGTTIRYGGHKAGLTFLGKGNVATALGSAVIDTGATVWAYAKGEISGEEAAERIGQNGMSTMSSIYIGAAAGALFGPAGAIAGSVAGYLVASSLYSSCVALLRSARLAEEEAIRIEALCAASIAHMEAECHMFEKVMGRYLGDRQSRFQASLDTIRNAVQQGDDETSLKGLNDLANNIGVTLLNIDTFDHFMLSEQGPLRL